MSLKTCKECGKPVNTSAASCPHCGHVLRRNRGCLTISGRGALVVVGLVVLGAMIGPTDRRPSSTAQSPANVVSADKAATVNDEGQTMSIGYTSYAVSRTRWATHLSDNPYLDKRPNARYLFVKLTVRNDDTKPRTVASFRLTDENGAIYETDTSAWTVEGSIGLIENLNPSVSKRGLIVFDVPAERTYKLQVSGGFWSSDEALVRLNPKAAR
jgi:Domain of unknown function (DUF4352)